MKSTQTSPETSNRVMIFANPIAGRGRGKIIAHALETRLRSENYEVQTFWNRAADIPTQQLISPARAAIVIGGDGTLRAAIERLLAADVLPPLLPVPLGTANMMGKYLGIRSIGDDLPGRVSRSLTNPTIRLLDAGRANGRLFIQVVGVGFDAQVVYHLDRMRHGPISFWSYLLPSALALFEFAPTPISVMVDGKMIFSKNCGFAFIGNLSQYGTGFPILVDARPDDGLLDVCVVPCKNRAQLIHLFLTAAIGEHPFVEGAVYRKGKRVAVTSPESVRVEIDGDPGGHTPIHIDLLPVRLPFIVP